jgi:AhpD family alkylhydroperoxidase
VTSVEICHISPAAIEALSSLETLLHAGGLEQSLIELVKVRASQINGCAFCINVQAPDICKHDEKEQQLALYSARCDARLYTDRERGALAWTEAVTLISETRASEDIYNEVRQHFSEVETMNLTMLIATVNVWNWLAVSFRGLPPPNPKVALPLDQCNDAGDASDTNV